MMTLQAPPIPKPEDIMNALQNASAQSVNGILMTLSAPLEMAKGLGIPVPQMPQLPAPAGGTVPPKTVPTASIFGIPLPFVGGGADVTYEPYSSGAASEGGQADVTIESGKKKVIWV